MTLLLNVVLLFWLQVPAPRVIVGLVDGQQVVVENPQFSGFIETRGEDVGLKYRQKNFHGSLNVKSIARVDFGKYDKDEPFRLTVTLKNGEKIEVLSEGAKFLTVRGSTDVGTVLIKHPDPISAPGKLRTSDPNRKNDLKITYLEFPTP
jgi:hypothetical protein